METDFKEIGFKAGLEVHQQLDTGKLFCRCPSLLKEGKEDFEFKRKLRPVASELGKFDPAALEAYKKNYIYSYKYFNDVNCLIEADEEPPKEMDEKALRTVLEIALMSESEIIDEIHVMRKTVIDGSNTSGFQRTALIALGGKIKLEKKEIGIQTIALEEDSAKLIEKKDKEIIYSLDRLGIPLIELATKAEIFSPKEAKETALKIGELFRRTGKTKRGLGSIRQDINISIAKGARTEIKGVQELEMIDVFAEKEISRQIKLIELKEELEKRNASQEELEKETTKELSEIFLETTCKTIKEKKVFGIKLAKFNGLIGKELQEGRRFGTELANYVKAKTGLKGIFHSDELPKYGITEKEVDSVKEKLNCQKEDGFVLVSAEEKKAVKALKVVIERSIQALKGVPEETRNALLDGTSEYSRPLPGAARMYPETDIPIKEIKIKELEKMKIQLPLTAEQRKIKYINKYKISEQLAEKMKLSNYARFYEKMMEKRFNPTTTAVLLLEGLTTLKRQGTKIENISEEMIEKVLDAVRKKNLIKDNQLKVLELWAEEKDKPFEAILAEVQETGFSEEKLKEIIKEVIKNNNAIINTQGANVFSALMGNVMIEIKGKASGKDASRILKEELKKIGIEE
ncbi:Glu-tRNA(Gln) amidotransferase subunit GatE [Candidatus Micrarchaeota archaeon]|nr:Glu-tRNA(Gln) amidotransferase subunit GatE [Candidatus Micrarchaeota archaeon]MBU2476766.1 Glu-tRNA(Gln) amidotransferase subunit GatE [Candidatus Micrarchaeota archaeon]